MADERILRRLPQLQKLHLTVPAPMPDLLGVSQRLIEVTRITGALSVGITPVPGTVDLDQQIAAAVAILRAVNDPPPLGYGRTPKAALTLVYYPYYWHTFYPRPTSFAYPGYDPACTPCAATALPFPCPDDPRERCHDDQAVTEYALRVEAVKAQLAAGPEAHRPIIGQQFFDTERWATNGQPPWDAAITAKHNRFYDRGKLLLDGVPIYQYERASVTYVDFPLTHGYSRGFGNYYNLDERGDSFGVSLYTVPDLDRMRAMLQATIDNAVANAPPSATNLIIVPWVGLACGNRDFASTTDEPFKADWDYGVRRTRDLALWLRHFVPIAPPSPTITIAAIGIYPGPFTRSTPHWAKHFIEFVRASAE